MMFPDSKQSAQPLVSVIVPTYNRAEILKECLAALALQDFPFGTFEVVVVDDGSSDNTAQVVRQARSDFRIHYLRQENRGPAAARNNGVRHARGEYVLIINDDAIAFKNLVAGHYYMHRKMGDAQRLAVLGTREFRDRDKVRPLNFLYDQVPFSMRVFNLEQGFYPAPYFVTFNISLKKSDFDSLGGFDEDFPSAIAEDTEFGIRWELSGGKIFFLPQLRAHHIHDVTVDGLKSQIVRENFNTLIMVHKQKPYCKANEIFRQPESAMREYVDGVRNVMQQIETGMREWEALSIWDLEGRRFIGEKIDNLTDLVIGIRRIYLQFHKYVALERYLGDPECRAMVRRWDQPPPEQRPGEGVWSTAVGAAFAAPAAGVREGRPTVIVPERFQALPDHKTLDKRDMEKWHRHSTSSE